MEKTRSMKIVKTRKIYHFKYNDVNDDVDYDDYDKCEDIGKVREMKIG